MRVYVRVMNRSQCNKDVSIWLTGITEISKALCIGRHLNLVNRLLKLSPMRIDSPAVFSQHHIQFKKMLRIQLC